MIAKIQAIKEGIEANKAEVEKQLAEIENLKAAQLAQQELLDLAKQNKEHEFHPPDNQGDGTRCGKQT